MDERVFEDVLRLHSNARRDEAMVANESPGDRLRRIHKFILNCIGKQAFNIDHANGLIDY